MYFKKEHNFDVSYRIDTWKMFDREIRSGGCGLLKRLDEYPGAILVSGCQRSGTTILSRVLTQSVGMVNYWSGGDDELDAALILSGYVEHKNVGRYCFQTTYVNECLEEYFSYSNYKMIWVLRNPFSVVYSMLHNWPRAALKRLFKSCGATLLDKIDQRRCERYGCWWIGSVRRACLSYNAKVSQVFELKKHLRVDNIMIIDYEDLVMRKRELVPELYRFVKLPYREYYAERIHANSMHKMRKQTEKERRLVEEMCLPVYLEARKWLTWG